VQGTVHGPTESPRHQGGRCRGGGVLLHPHGRAVAGERSEGGRVRGGGRDGTSEHGIHALQDDDRRRGRGARDARGIVRGCIGLESGTPSGRRGTLPSATSRSSGAST
jgi:hypothetical protein